MRHHQIKTEGFVLRRQCAEAFQRFGNTRLHIGKGTIDPHHSERRIDHRALASPCLAGRHKNRIADERVERIHHEIGFRENALLVNQHFAHKVRAVHNQSRAAGPAERADIHFIGSPGQEVQKIAVAAAHRANKRGQSGEGCRAGRVIHGRRDSGRGEIKTDT